MSSTGIQAINSGPLIIRVYSTSSTNRTYVLQDEDLPVSSNLVLVTSTSGQLVPSDNIFISSIVTSSLTTSSVNASSIFCNTFDTQQLITSSIVTNSIQISTLIASTIFGQVIRSSTIVASSIFGLSTNASSIVASSLRMNSLITSSCVASTFQVGTLQTSTIIISTLTAPSTASISTLQVSTILTELIVSSANGRILLGTGTPAYRFEINNGGGVATSFANNGWRYGNGGGAANGPTQSDVISMKTQFGIWATIFYATSDRRIKTNITEINDGNAINVVRQIKPVTFNYVDQINRHSELEYGFIAQDVKSVLPHAVKMEVDYIPNIYDMGDVSTMSNTASLITLRNKTVHDIQPSDILQLYDLCENPLTYEVLETRSSSIIVKGVILEQVADYTLSPDDIKNNILKNTVFVYGKKVDDLHVLDKHAIFSVGMAAMQELDRTILQQSTMIVEQNQKIKELQEKCKKLQQEITT